MKWIVWMKWKQWMPMESINVWGGVNQSLIFSLFSSWRKRREINWFIDGAKEPSHISTVWEKLIICRSQTSSYSKNTLWLYSSCYKFSCCFSLSWLLLFFSCGLGPAWRRRKQLAWNSLILLFFNFLRFVKVDWKEEVAGLDCFFLVGYRPEAHLPHSSLHFKNSILSIPELLALFFSFPAEQTASLELSYLLKKEKEEESLVVCWVVSWATNL